MLLPGSVGVSAEADLTTAPTLRKAVALGPLATAAKRETSGAATDTDTAETLRAACKVAVVDEASVAEDGEPLP
jgi:hypothetical protein